MSGSVYSPLKMKEKEMPLWEKLLYAFAVALGTFIGLGTVYGIFYSLTHLMVR